MSDNSKKRPEKGVREIVRIIPGANSVKPFSSPSPLEIIEQAFAEVAQKAPTLAVELKPIFRSAVLKFQQLQVEQMSAWKLGDGKLALKLNSGETVSVVQAFETTECLEFLQSVLADLQAFQPVAGRLAQLSYDKSFVTFVALNTEYIKLLETIIHNLMGKVVRNG